MRSLHGNVAVTHACPCQAEGWTRKAGTELMHDAEFHVRQRQQELLNAAAAHRRARQARKLARVARRAERAERQLTRSWHTALRLRAELRQLANDPRP